MKYIFALILFTVCFPSYADVYQSTDGNGNILYTDTPSQQAERLILPRLDLPPKQPQVAPESNAAPSGATETKANAPYTLFALKTPKDQETLQNESNVTLTIDIKPDLQPGDKIQIYMDGKPIGTPAPTTSFNLGRLERGTHQFYAELMDAQNKVINKTGLITLYLHYANTNTFRNIK